MKRITSNKQEPYFGYIRDGVKTIEGWLRRDKWESLEKFGVVGLEIKPVVFNT